MTNENEEFTDEQFLEWLIAIDEELRKEEIKFNFEIKNDLNCKVKPIHLGKPINE